MIGSTNMYTVLEALTIMLGLVMLAFTIGVAVMLAMREESDRPLFPWGARMRVEKAKAHTAMLQAHLDQEALEVKRLAIDYHRDALVKAIADGVDPMDAYRIALQQLPPAPVTVRTDPYA